MKCPSCGIWNRAHFTKCFRCGADLPPAPDSGAEKKAVAGAEPVGPAESAPPAEAPSPTAKPDAMDLERELQSGEIFSLYDEGNWSDEEEEDTEEVYGFPPAGAQSAEKAPDAAPLIRPVAVEEDAEDDEPVTVYRAPQKAVPAAPKAPAVPTAPEAEDDEPVTVYRAPQKAVPAAPKAPAVPTAPAAEDDEPVTVYRAPQKTAPAKPKAPAVPTAPAAEDDEPATVYRAAEPAQAQEPTQETRRFAPVVGKQAAASPVRPIPTSPEPEVAPPDPAINHEIIHAIFTNPPSRLGGRGTSPVDEPRPRKLMSRRRLPPAPETEDEPQTVYKPRPAKAEPRVERVEDFKPTARLSAKKADEQGDEFKAFATAKRNLVAEVQNTDPFDEAIELPQPAAPADEEAAAAAKEAPAAAEEAPAAQQKPPVQPQKAPKPEQPAWVKEALSNLGQDEFVRPRSTARPRAGKPRTAPQTAQPMSAPSRSAQPPISDERSPRHERALRMEREREQQEREVFAPLEGTRRPSPRSVSDSRSTLDSRSGSDPRSTLDSRSMSGYADEGMVYGAPARSGLDAIARHEAARSASVLQRRNEERADGTRAHAHVSAESAPRRRETPVEPPVRRREAPREEMADARRWEAPREGARAPRSANRERSLPSPERPTRARSQEEVPMRLHSSRSGSGSSGGSDDGHGGDRGGNPLAGLRVQNLQRMIIVGVAAILLLALIVFGVVMGVRALANREPGTSAPADSPAPEETPATSTDPNAPTVTTGEVNGRPGHIITFKGNDGDLIYITNEDLGTSYNVSIAGGVGTLQVEDSALIGNRIVNDDVEVTLNPVLHQAGSGQETDMDPITFVVTPPDAYLEIVSPAGGADDTTLGTYQVKIRVETGSTVTIGGEDVSDLITEDESGVGTIIYNVDVTPTGENTIPIVVMKEGCKSVTQNIVITRPVMEVPIELDASTPSTVESDTVTISGSVAPGVQIQVTSPTEGEVTTNDDGTFSFVAKMSSFGDNDVVITATSGDKSSTLTHTITYLPTASEYVEKAYKMDYNALSNYAGTYQPFLCTGSVSQVFSTDPYTCLYNVGTADAPKYIYLEMVDGKSLEEGKTYNVYADVHADATHDGYPYMIGRYYYDAETTAE
ncbi:MAG: hypothetical protein ACOX83_05770 [Candidatus Spyradocola sp.]|jgi:hypothetical protein